MEELIRWRKSPKSGSHTFWFDGKKFFVRPGEVVVCPESCLGRNAIKSYENLGSIEMDQEDVVEEEGAQLVLIAAEKGFWNIVNVNNIDKPLNDKPMRKSQAEKLMGELLQEIEPE